MATEAGLLEVARYRGYLGHRYALAFVHAGASGALEAGADTGPEADAA
jgi:hypothetical protein